MKDMLATAFTKLQGNVEYHYYNLWVRTVMSFVLKERT